ncbi:MAG: spore germination protein GerW family protein [Myxococcota bacterium]|jgi:uncharacterized spore protein YtfJ|nr:spore germination protein GerW family protein [Myxococcota bacterium]
MQNIVEMLGLAGEELSSMAKSEIVVGEPIELEGNTIVPISRIGFGLGCGAGAGRGALTEREARRHHRKDAKGQGSGGGAGGGVTVRPVAVIVFAPDGVQILTVEEKPGPFAALLEQIPDFVGKLKLEFGDKESKQGKESAKI